MELIDRYVYAVTQKLPPVQRKDIAKELQGLIEDMLEERTQGKPPSKRDIEEVLLELGNPRELAQQYRGMKKYLIGPELFDSYMLVLKIVLISLTAVIAASFAIRAMINPVSVLDHFIDFIVSTVTALPAAFGWTTLAFAVAEHIGSLKAKDLHLDQDWSPIDLPSIPHKGTINRREPIAGITIYTILLLFFMFSMDYFGIWIFRDGFTGTIPFINEHANDLFLLFIIIVLGFGILKESLKLIYRRWNTKIVVFTFILNLISFIVVLYCINQPDFWNPNFMHQLVQQNILTEGTEAYTIVQSVWMGLTKWIPIIFAIGLVWDVIDGFIKVRKTNHYSTR